MRTYCTNTGVYRFGISRLIYTLLFLATICLSTAVSFGNTRNKDGDRIWMPVDESTTAIR